MIGIENQYFLSFNIADNIDFINERDLQKFKVIEYSGEKKCLFSLVLKYGYLDSRYQLGCE